MAIASLVIGIIFLARYGFSSRSTVRNHRFYRLYISVDSHVRLPRRHCRTNPGHSCFRKEINVALLLQA